MTPEVTISAEKLGKKYLIAHQGKRERYKSLRDTIAGGAVGFGRSLADRVNGQPRTSQATTEEFWALRDVSFEIKRGDVVGVIGRNGAGKSTLLKLLSRITEPSEGRVTIRGRVASLLEVGTGFHPELTGRENIYLNGAILGMLRAEINSKFDEIVTFAGVEKFLDTPVKRYSSGMYVRLAFAVAAHLEPEILVVDEVLAIGDAEFQKKCLGKMKDVSRSGRTILFVSHNMNAIEALCSKILTLSGGRIYNYGYDVLQSIRRYLSAEATGGGNAEWRNQGTEFQHPTMQPIYFALVNRQGHSISQAVRNDEELYVVIRANIIQLDPALCMGFSLFNEAGQELLRSLSTDGPEDEWPRMETGMVEVRCALPKRLLNEGRYRLELDASLHHRDWFVRPGRNSPTI